MPRSDSAGYVPWFSPEQFRKVYRYLYSPELSDKRWAVDQISVWETLCFPTLPSGVECTFNITRAIVQDTLFENDATFCQEREIQNLYCMALIRFVNLTAELKKGVYSKRRLRDIAFEIGIPPWIVTLRHDATHSFCPSLPVLRVGAKVAMQYLDKTFWQPQASRVHAWMKTPDTNEQEIRSLISAFQYHQYEKIRKFIPLATDDENQAKLLEEIRDRIKKFKKKFIQIFIQPDAFIFTEDMMRDILQNDEKPFLDDDTVCSLPKSFEDFWMPIIVLLHNYDLMPAFLEILLLTQEGRESIQQKYVIAWETKIIHSITLCGESNSLLCYIFKQQGTIFDWAKLSYSCLRYPCKYTTFLFPMLLSLLHLNKEWTRKYLFLIAIFQGHAADMKSDFLKGNHVFTVEDIKKARRRKRGLPREESTWTFAPDCINFSKLPIGAILNAYVDDKTVSNGDILEDETMNYLVDNEKLILSNESDKEQEEENIDSSSSKKDEQTNSSNKEDVYMVYKRRRK